MADCFVTITGTRHECDDASFWILCDRGRDGTAGNGPGALPRGVQIGSGAAARFALQFNRAEPPISDITIRVQVSETLDATDWTTIAQKPGTLAWSGPATVTEGTPAGGRAEVTVEDTQLMNDALRRFIRILVELDTP